MKYFTSILILAVTAFLSGCSSSSDDSTTATTSTATIRLANITPQATLTMSGVGNSDTSKTFSTASVASGAVSSYVTVDAQGYTLGVTDPSNALTADTQTATLTADTEYTLLSFARSGSVNSYLLFDDTVEPASGFASLTIGNVAGDVGSVDVYLVAPGANLSGATPQFVSILAKSTSSAKTLAAGTYDIVVTAAGKPTDVRLALSGIALQSTKVVTLALTPTLSGSLVGGALIEQGGGVTLKPATVSRVRVVGGFPASAGNNATVAVTIGGTSLGTLTAPSVGSYKLVTGSTSVYSVAVNGVAVGSLPAATFATGGDYTILVCGTTAAPIVRVLWDQNQPSSTAYANLRLINAAVDGGITLFDNYVPVNVDVQYGTASEYAPAVSSSTSLLQITSPVLSFPTYSASSISIASSGVYTVFVLGSTTSPIVSLSRDR